VKKLILAMVMILTMASGTFAQLGSAASDLVFNPITPCRLLDTRFATTPAGTPIAANSTRNFLVWGQTSFASQGGAASNCGLTASSNTAALAVNFTVVTPTTGGYMTAFPADVASPPLAATVNFEAGSVRGNSAIVRIAQGSSTSLSIYTTSQTHVVADVVGYYAKPVSLGSFECQTQRGAVLVLANSSNTADKLCNDPNSPPMPVPPLIMTGGGCDFDAYGPSLVLSKSTPNLDNTGWFCRWQNATATDITAFVYARCCRIPGR
jgi:hypothetical protein